MTPWESDIISSARMVRVMMGICAAEIILFAALAVHYVYGG